MFKIEVSEKKVMAEYDWQCLVYKDDAGEGA